MFPIAFNSLSPFGDYVYMSISQPLALFPFVSSSYTQKRLIQRQVERCLYHGMLFPMPPYPFFLPGFLDRVCPLDIHILHMI
jgi:hypothetical protein